MSSTALCGTSCRTGMPGRALTGSSALRAEFCRPAQLRGRLAHVCVPTATATRAPSVSIQLPQLPLLPGRRQAEPAPAAPEPEQPDLGIPAPPVAVELERPVLGLAGGGIFFWWELGVLKYLQANFNLAKVSVPVVKTSK